MDTTSGAIDMKYLAILRLMSPEERLLKSMELTRISRELFLAGFRSRHPELPEAEIKRQASAQLLKWNSSTSSY